MTQDQEDKYRAAIAKFFGWKNDAEGYWISPEGVEYQVMFGWQIYKDGTDILPDYFGDLNDIQNAVMTLKYPKNGEFINRLQALTKGTEYFSETAPARLRAFAFMETVGLKTV